MYPWHPHEHATTARLRELVACIDDLTLSAGDELVDNLLTHCWPTACAQNN